MPSRYEDLIYGPFSEESTTANEVNRRVGMTNKTASRAPTRRGVRYKQSGRVHVFWREKA
jgi:hypothetical protein